LTGGAAAFPPGLFPSDTFMNEEGFASLWMGTGPSMEALLEYVALKYNEDCEIVPSQFMIDFRLDPWDENFREVAFREERWTTVASALEGCSWDDQVIPQFEKQIGKTLAFPVNALILLFDYNHQRETKNASTDGTSMRYMGVATYKS
jgi:hypothetical protein